MDFTQWLILNWLIAGFLFGFGWTVAQAVYDFIFGVLARRRASPDRS